MQWLFSFTLLCLSSLNLFADPLDTLLHKISEKTLDPKIAGSTTDLGTGTFVEQGSLFLAVSLAGGSSVPSQISQDTLTKELHTFVKQHTELKKAGLYLGTWWDKDGGLIYIDVSQLIPYKTDPESFEKARKQAQEFSIQNGQKSIYDFGKSVSFPVQP